MLLLSYARDILEHAKAQTVLPDSAKVLVFDSMLPLKQAFYALVEHDMKAAPVYDANTAQYAGMVTVTDFIDVILQFSKESKEMFAMAMERETCQSWADRKPNKKVFVAMDPDDTVIKALQIMHEKKIHRLPVILKQENESTVLGILNHQRILRYLVSKLQAKHGDLLKNVTVNDLNFEAAHELKYFTSPNTKLIDVLTVIQQNRLPVIPIVDESGKYLDAYSRSDVRFLAMDQTYDRLEVPVEEALADHKASRVIPSIRIEESVESMFKKLLSTRKHACIVVDAEEKAKGIISLSDIFELILKSEHVPEENKS